MGSSGKCQWWISFSVLKWVSVLTSEHGLCREGKRAGGWNVETGSSWVSPSRDTRNLSAWDRAKTKQHTVLLKRRKIWVNNRLRQTNSTRHITGQKGVWLCPHAWALACLSWRILVTGLKRCSTASFSVPPSWRCCWLSSVCAGRSAGRSTFGSRSRHHPVRVWEARPSFGWCLFVRTLGGGGNEVFH